MEDNFAKEQLRSTEAQADYKLDTPPDEERRAGIEELERVLHADKPNKEIDEEDTGRVFDPEKLSAEITEGLKGDGIVTGERDTQEDDERANEKFTGSDSVELEKAKAEQVGS